MPDLFRLLLLCCSGRHAGLPGFFIFPGSLDENSDSSERRSELASFLVKSSLTIDESSCDEVTGMFQDEKLCAICGSKTEEGFILDFAHQGQTASRWVAGKPDRMISGVVAFNDRQNLHVAAFRCESCGHLEFYAIHPPVKY